MLFVINMERRIKVFIDTNVLVDYFQEDRVGHATATELFYLVYNSLVEAAISTQSILDAAYVCRRHPAYDASLFRESALFMLGHTNSSYIDTFDLKTALCDPDPDIEDSAQIAFAYSQRCDIVVTHDNRLLSRDVPSPIQVMSPENFVNLCRA